MVENKGLILAERVGFEPTCRLRDKTLSRRPRYDHFGTSPLGEMNRVARKLQLYQSGVGSRESRSPEPRTPHASRCNIRPAMARRASASRPARHPTRAAPGHPAPTARPGRRPRRPPRRHRRLPRRPRPAVRRPPQHRRRQRLRGRNPLRSAVSRAGRTKGPVATWRSSGRCCSCHRANRSASSSITSTPISSVTSRRA